MNRYVDIVNGAIVDVFGGPQDPAAYPGYAEIEETDARWVAYQAAQARAPLVASALAALDEDDTVAIRCAKAGIAYPVEWLARDQKLRAIVNGSDTTSTAIPEKPAYPAGT